MPFYHISPLTKNGPLYELHGVSLRKLGDPRSFIGRIELKFFQCDNDIFAHLFTDEGTDILKLCQHIPSVSQLLNPIFGDKSHRIGHCLPSRITSKLDPVMLTMSKIYWNVGVITHEAVQVIQEHEAVQVIQELEYVKLVVEMMKSPLTAISFNNYGIVLIFDTQI